MDIAQHKKEMEALVNFLKAKEENPEAEVSLPESYKLSAPASYRTEEEEFDYKRLRELAEYMNRNYDEYAVTEDQEFIAKFNEYKADLIESSRKLPWDLFEMEHYLSALHSIPKGLSWNDDHGFTSALECSQCVEETDALWKVETFNDVVMNLKEASIVEFNSANGKSACTFSFTDKAWDENYDIQGIISDIGKMNQCDIDNMLLLANVNFFEDEEGEDAKDKYDFPADFEDVLIESIVDTGYTFKYYGQGPAKFIDAFRNVKLDKMVSFLQSRSGEKLVVR